MVGSVFVKTLISNRTVAFEQLLGIPIRSESEYRLGKVSFGMPDKDPDLVCQMVWIGLGIPMGVGIGIPIGRLGLSNPMLDPDCLVPSV